MGSHSPITTFRRTRYRLGILPLGRCPVNALQGDFAALRQNVYWHFPREASNLHFHRVFIPSDYPDSLDTARGRAMDKDRHGRFNHTKAAKRPVVRSRR